MYEKNTKYFITGQFYHYNYGISGLFGMILEQFPFVLTIHRVISIGILCFLAIHIFVFHKNFFKKILK